MDIIVGCSYVLFKVVLTWFQVKAAGRVDVFLWPTSLLYPPSNNIIYPSSLVFIIHSTIIENKNSNKVLVEESKFTTRSYELLLR